MKSKTLKTKLILGIIIFVYYILVNAVFADTLTVGYREGEKLPLIGEKGDDSGLYFDLYSMAAKKMNCDLQIIRMPKKRIITNLKKGEIDFYPGFTFTEERIEFAYFIENGLPGGGHTGLSLKSFPTITNLQQLKGRKVLVTVGGAVADLISHVEGVKTYEVSELTIKKAISLIRLKRHDFYIYNRSSIEYYLKINNVKDIKLHPDCCGGINPMYLGFSRTSPNFKEIPNPNYDSTKPISISNFPSIIANDCLAYKLALTLQSMKESGEIQKLYDKYYK